MTMQTISQEGKNLRLINKTYSLTKVNLRLQNYNFINTRFKYDHR